jgi:hypothetical protein
MDGTSKRLLIASGILIFLFTFGGTFFFLGKRSVGNSVTPPTPTVLPSIIDQQAKPTLPQSSPTSSLSVSPSPSPIPKNRIIYSTPALDGFRSSNSGGNDVSEIRAGRNESLVSRGFVSFNISDIPSGATIILATLRLYQTQIIGNPYSVSESLKVDHLTFGDSLDASDYGAAALSSSFTTLSQSKVIEWKEIEVSNAVKDDIANARTKSQFRIHFRTENTGGDATGDFAYFEAAENTMKSGNLPQLIVKYY